MQRIDNVNSMHVMLHFITVAHMHLPYPVQACGIINQLAKKIVNSLTISPVKRVKARSQKQNLLPP